LHSPAARPPRLLIYLHGPLDVISERIATRGRPKEKEAPPEYWHLLHERYQRWIAKFRHCPVLSLDVRDYDLVADAGAIEDIAGRVRLRLGGGLRQRELGRGVSGRRAKALNCPRLLASTCASLDIAALDRRFGTDLSARPVVTKQCPTFPPHSFRSPR